MASSCEHSGHRERVKKRFISSGLDGFELHEALELLLFYAIPRRDTNLTAHKLINDIGSFSAVFDAPIDVLTNAGVSENTAILLKLLPEMIRLYIQDKHDNNDKIVDFSNIGKHIVYKFFGRKDECCVLLLTDAKGKEIFNGVISKGSINATDISIRKIVDLAVRYNARNAVIAHNHPSGVAVPSIEDIQTTKSLANVLRAVGVNLVDHLIVADNDYVALSECGVDSGLLISRDED